MAKFGTNDDLFESSTMTFGEHLDELRICLVRAAIGLAVGIGVGLLLGQYVVDFFNAPLERAIIRYKVLSALDKIGAQYPKNTPEAEANAKLNKNVDSNHKHIPPEILEVVQQERLIPEPILIDSAELFSNFASVLPPGAAALTVDPWSFSVNDLRRDDYSGLCKVLLKANEMPADSPAK